MALESLPNEGGLPKLRQEELATELRTKLAEWVKEKVVVMNDRSLLGEEEESLVARLSEAVARRIAPQDIGFAPGAALLDEGEDAPGAVTLPLGKVAPEPDSPSGSPSGSVISTPRGSHMGIRSSTSSACGGEGPDLAVQVVVDPLWAQHLQKDRRHVEMYLARRDDLPRGVRIRVHLTITPLTQTYTLRHQQAKALREVVQEMQPADWAGWFRECVFLDHNGAHFDPTVEPPDEIFPVTFTCPQKWLVFQYLSWPQLPMPRAFEVWDHEERKAKCQHAFESRCVRNHCGFSHTGVPPRPVAEAQQTPQQQQFAQQQDWEKGNGKGNQEKGKGTDKGKGKGNGKGAKADKGKGKGAKGGV